ncbi:MAG: hypothetical protein ACRDJH_17450 [Thermomicrobiales bacterium]
MRHVSLVVSVLVLMVAPLLLPATAKAGVSFQDQFRGQSAFALFSSADPADPCIVTEVFVFATEGRVQEPPGPPTPEAFAFTTIARFHVCGGGVLLAAFGSTTTPDFQGDRALKSATLAATMTVEDVHSGSVFDVVFDVAWAGTGNPVRLNQHFHFQDPGFIVNFHVNEASRQAVASGSVSDGVTDFTAGAPAEIAEIGWFSGGSVEVTVG